MTTPRINAIARQCKRLEANGNCECVSPSCKLSELCATRCGELGREIGERQFEMDTLCELSAATRKADATIRDGWVRPTPPDVGYFLQVINDGGEWCMFWHSDSHGEDCIVIEGDVAWPFNEDTARTRDWQLLGIEVV